MFLAFHLISQPVFLALASAQRSEVVYQEIAFVWPQ